MIDLVGFKCHRCRKKSSPICPYKRERTDKNGLSARREKLPVKRSQKKVSKSMSQDSDTSDRKRLKVMHSESGKTLNELGTILNAGEKVGKRRSQDSSTLDRKRLKVMHSESGKALNELGTILNGEEKVSKRMWQDSNTLDRKPLNVMHSESGKTLKELGTILTGEEKHASIKFDLDSKDTIHDLLKYNQQIHGTIECDTELKHAAVSSVLDINQSGEELKVFQSPDFYHGTMKTKSDSKHVPETSPLDMNQADSNLLKYQQSEPSSIHTESLCKQGDKGLSSTDWPHNQKIEVRNIMPTTVEAYPENEPLFTFTELLACENDQMEDLVDLNQGIVGSWSDGLSTCNDSNMDSQHMKVETDGDQFPGVMISSNTAHAQLENKSQEETTMEFEPNGAANSVVSEEAQFYTVDSTISYEEEGSLCNVCGLTVFHSGYQCKVCGVVIHQDCSEFQYVDVWTGSGWTCNNCQGGLGECQRV